MTRKVRISTLAPRAPQAWHFDLPRLVCEMTEYHWKPALERVLPDKPDLIVLPEMCDFYGNFSAEQTLEYSQIRGDCIFEFFRNTACQNNCYLTYPTIIERADGTRRNSVILFDRRGEIVGTYNKNNVMVEETTMLGMLSSSQTPIFECDFGRVACVICFDLNFDALRLQYAAKKPDLILFSSIFHGGLMQQYWAYACRAHLVASVAGLPSAMISPQGKELASTTNYTDYATSVLNLDCCVAHLDYNRDKFTALKGFYGSGVTISDPGFLGSVLISSETSAASILEMVKQFDIELLEDYLARAIEHNSAFKWHES